MTYTPPKFTHCQEFMAWLESYNPHWNLESTGDIEGLFDAWEAGRQSMSNVRLTYRSGETIETTANEDRHLLCYTIDV